MDDLTKAKVDAIWKTLGLTPQGNVPEKYPERPHK